MSPLPPSPSPPPAPPRAAPPGPLRAVGVLGGTFDPIHHAHLFSAEVAAAAHGLQRVLLVPASRSPLKTPAAGAPEDRVAMARLGAAGSPLLEVSTVEVDRPPPSYMADTLALLASRYPQAALSLILGIDALRDFLLWREPERVLDQARLIVVPRPGYALRIPPSSSGAWGPARGASPCSRCPSWRSPPRRSAGGSPPASPCATCCPRRSRTTSPAGASTAPDPGPSRERCILGGSLQQVSDW